MKTTAKQQTEKKIDKKKAQDTCTENETHTFPQAKKK